MLGPTTYCNLQMNEIKILIFHDVHADVYSVRTSVKGYCRVGVKESESEDDSS